MVKRALFNSIRESAGKMPVPHRMPVADGRSAGPFGFAQGRPPSPAWHKCVGLGRPTLQRVGSGFTLVEMLVALAVTVVALALVTVVFSVTTKTATQAVAVSRVESLIRNFMLQLEQDLKHCDPTDSVLVLVGRTQAAARTQDDLDAGRYYRVLTGDPNDVPSGYQPEFNAGLDPPGTNGFPDYSDPRADILMFFSSRPSASQAPPTGAPADNFQQALQDGAKFSPIQMVYGHAAFDHAVLSGGPGSPYVFAGNLRHIEQTLPDGSGRSILAANRWHLARRATIIESVATVSGLPKVMFDGVDTGRIVQCYSSDNRFAGDAARLDMGALLRYFSYEDNVTLSQAPYAFPGAWRAPLSLPHPVQAIRWLLYSNGVATPNHHVATVLETPPADLRSNLGLHALPGCVWFQVEFLMPEDPRNSLDWPPPSAPPPAPRRTDMPRWTEVQAGSTYVFVPDTAANREAVASLYVPGGPSSPDRLWNFAYVDPNLVPTPHTVANRRIRMWPYAIRITVRVYDPQGRLDDPVVRSLVHRFE